MSAVEPRTYRNISNRKPVDEIPYFLHSRLKGKRKNSHREVTVLGIQQQSVMSYFCAAVSLTFCSIQFICIIIFRRLLLFSPNIRFIVAQMFTNVTSLLSPLVHIQNRTVSQQNAFSVTPNNNIHELKTTHNLIVIQSGMRFEVLMVMSLNVHEIQC
jgi:hypothetical protein